MAIDNKLITVGQVKAVTDTKLDASKVYDGLDQTVAGYVLDAKQGKILKEMAENAISNVTINGDYLQVGNTNLTIPYATKAQKDASGNTITETYAPIASPNLTGTPTAPTANAGTNSTQIATTAFVANAVSSMAAAAEAMVFKGTISSAAGLPATHKQGWTYKVTTAGQYVGVQCEIGDMIICIADGTVASNSDWTVVQANIDGAVTGPTNAVDSRIAVFDGATGKVIKDSGFTIGTSVPSGAVFTDTDTSVTSAANHYTPQRDTSADKTADATGATAEWGIDVVKGVTVQTDSKGHVTGVAVTSGKMPTNPNTDTHRPIQINGTQVLGDNTTALNLAAGSNVGLVESEGTVTISATDTTYESKAAAANGTEVSLVTTGEKAIWNAKTSNEGTVTSVVAGVGLTGGSITTSGTIKAKLKSETALTNNAVAATETAGRVYPVAVDSSGDLAVNVPWTDTDTTYTAGTGIDITNEIVTNTGVRSVASGTTNGTISVNTNGTNAEVAVAGLGSSAYASIANNLTTTTAGSVLDASQGKALKDEVEVKAGRYIFTVGVPTSAWTETNSIYTATVTVNGIQNDDSCGGIGVLQTGDEETDNEIRNNWADVIRVTAGNNSITLYSVQEPTMLIPLIIEVFRGKEEKKTGIIGLDTNNVTIDSDEESATVGFFKFGGTVSASSGDETVATVSVTNNEIVISRVGTGNTEVTVSLSGDDKYNATSEIITVITPPPPPIYGVVWDKSSNTTLTRTDDAALFTNPIPAVGPESGSSPFDDILPWSGMVRETIDGNEMVKIPKFYYKWTDDTRSLKLQISSTGQTGFHVSPAHADRGDGVGERDYVYVGRYHCGNDYTSKTGVYPVRNITRATARTGCTSVGMGYYQYDYAMLWTIRMLYLVEYADWDAQKVIGYGCSPSGSVFTMGYSDDMEYHTGTDTASRATYGGTQYRYIEGLWDNVRDWCDGIVISSNVPYVTNVIANYGDDISNHINVSDALYFHGEITDWAISAIPGLEWALYPNATMSNSNYDAYVADHINAGGVVVYTGGYWYQDRGSGLFSLGGVSVSNSSGNCGARLQYLPPAS